MLRRRLRQLRESSERGTVIVIVAGCLVMIIAAGAYAIDNSAGRQQQQQAQSAADAAALAAADVIPADNNSQSVAAVSQTGTTIATTNMPGASVSVTMPTATSAKVTVSGSSSNGIGRAFGSASERVSASATASLGTTTTTTGVATSPSNVAIYAGDDVCSDDSLSVAGSLLGTGLLGGLLGGILPSNSLNINGSPVISNGSQYYNTFNFGSNNSTFIYGGKNGCGYYGSTPSNSARVKSSADYAFPEPYTQAQIPSDCIQEGATFSLNLGNTAIPPGTYCASSSITITGVVSNLSLVGVSFIAPTITISSLVGSIQNWTPASNAPGGDLLAWATSGNLNVSLTALGNQINSMTGVLYAPSGTINLTANTINGTGLIEGNRVQIATQTMNYSGTGPATSTPGTTTSSTATGASNLTS